MKAGKDGGRENVGIDYDPFESFQYKKKCIDLTEFKQYLKAQIGDDIDLEDFESVFSDIKQQKD